MNRLILPSFYCLLLAGCVSTVQNRVDSDLVGLSVAEIESRWGSPASKKALPNGGELWNYPMRRYEIEKAVELEEDADYEPYELEPRKYSTSFSISTTENPVDYVGTLTISSAGIVTHVTPGTIAR